MTFLAANALQSDPANPRLGEAGGALEAAPRAAGPGCAACFSKFLRQTDGVKMDLQAMFCRRLQLTFNT